MSGDDTSGKRNDEAATPYDASLRVDTRSLSSTEQDFARLMGFGDDGNPPPEATAPADTRSEPPAPGSGALTARPEPPAEAVAPDPFPAPSMPAAAAGTPTEPPAPLEEVEAQPAPPARAVLPPAEAPPAERGSTRDWEEIHPRAATLGRQTALLERAARVDALDAGAWPDVEGEDLAAIRPGTADGRPGDAVASDALWRQELEARDARIAELEAMTLSLEAALAAPAATAPEPLGPGADSPARPAELEKTVERLRAELDALLVERDQLGDLLAVANAARAESAARVERLESAYRAARQPVGPLPEGERALRAEVTGLRRRLDEASAEARQLHARLEEAATNLAIARAQTEDRLEDLDAQQARIDALERERAAEREQLAESLARHRELLGLVARVQAENVELRSTQAALEETLEARDLEISAREEHLQVTRRGLAARDAQLIEAEERLEEARHAREQLEKALERSQQTRVELEKRLERRDARIATLSTTLARIEEAIGRTASPARGTEPERDAPEALEIRPDEPAAVEATLAVPRPAPFPRPAILARWRDAQIRAHGGEAAHSGLADFLADRLVSGGRAVSDAPLRITSVGGASLGIEVDLVRALAARGAENVGIHVLEGDETRAAARRRVVAAAALEATITVALAAPAPLADAPRTAPAACDVLLLVDALWGHDAPAALLDGALADAADDAWVLFADRLAGGPVTLSETTRAKLAELWAVLPESWTERPGFGSPPEAGDDGGTPAARDDWTALLAARLVPHTTVGFGHVADLFLGAARGDALDAAGDATDALLASIDAIDESRSILESLPPRHGVAVFRGRRHAVDDRDPGPEVLGLPWPGL